ncbi:MAG: DNA repair protein RecN [Clostridia bacterium]|nr:DNA repair protein RecN [Clostridia bacterium]
MLVQLTIQNIALIEKLSVVLEPGLNVMTGETGAGKSIVVGSLDFVLGGRTDKERISGGAERGQVEALFDVTALPKVSAALQNLGIEIEDGLLPVAREINRSGRNVCRVAGVAVPLSNLKDITSLLVDLHGQHAHQSLLSPATHLAFLDTMGDAEHTALVETVRSSFDGWSRVKRKLSLAQTDVMERARREDMLRFQLEELEDAKLSPGEEDALERQRSLMRGAERIREGLVQANALVSGGFDDDALSALDAMRAALNTLSTLTRYGGGYQEIYDRLAEAIYAVESVADDMSDLMDGAESDPERLEEVEARMDLLSRLRRKYGANTTEMLAFLANVRKELEESESTDARISALESEEQALLRALNEAAASLSEKRRTLAKECETRVLTELSELGMERGRFEVRFHENAALSADGFDAIEFMLSANVGVELQPLSRVASGGELSRIMLAFKCIEAENAGIPILVFDEIDTGISGRIGHVVADKLRKVGRTHQVLCVTHLPQIAANADAQYLVEKQETDGRTRTNVKTLDGEGRVGAIARMLGGEENTASAHARAMLESAGR